LRSKQSDEDKLRNPCFGIRSEPLFKVLYSVPLGFGI